MRQVAGAAIGAASLEGSGSARGLGRRSQPPRQIAEGSAPSAAATSRRPGVPGMFMRASRAEAEHVLRLHHRHAGRRGEREPDQRPVRLVARARRRVDRASTSAAALGGDDSYQPRIVSWSWVPV